MQKLCKAVRKLWACLTLPYISVILLGMTKAQDDALKAANPKHPDPDYPDPWDLGEFTCCRCGHGWRPRVLQPLRCPKCRSMKWATKRTETVTQAQAVEDLNASHDAVGAVVGTFVPQAAINPDFHRCYGWGTIITLKLLSEELGMDRSHLRKYVLALGIEPAKIRTSFSRNQLTLAVNERQAERIMQARHDAGFSTHPSPREEDLPFQWPTA